MNSEYISFLYCYFYDKLAIAAYRLQVGVMAPPISSSHVTLRNIPVERLRLPMHNWFAVELHRHKAAYAEANLRAQGFGVFHPKMWVTSRQFGRPVNRLRSLFPGYCFVNCDLSPGNWRAIKSSHGVRGFAGPTGIAPTPVGESLIHELMERCPRDIFDPTTLEVKNGQHVMVQGGPFNGAFGRIHELDDRGRVMILMSILGAERTLLVPRSSLRPANLAF